MNMDSIINNQELLKAVNSVNWDDILSKVNVSPYINVKSIDVSKHLVRKDDRAGRDMILEKISRLRELIDRDEANDDYYIEGFNDGLEVAILLLESKEIDI